MNIEADRLRIKLLNSFTFILKQMKKSRKSHYITDNKYIPRGYVERRIEYYMNPNIDKFCNDSIQDMYNVNRVMALLNDLKK